MKARLTKIVSSHNNLRTDEVVGELAFWPSTGERICMLGESLTDPDAHRSVITSPICKIEGDLFHTLNSVYRLERLDD